MKCILSTPSKEKCKQVATYVAYASVAVSTVAALFYGSKYLYYKYKKDEVTTVSEVTKVTEGTEDTKVSEVTPSVEL